MTNKKQNGIKEEQIYPMTFQITCFLQEDPDTLYPKLLPLGFSQKNWQTIMYQHELESRYTITGFTQRGRDHRGYRVSFNTKSTISMYLFDQTLNRYEPLITGVECKVQTNLTKYDLMKKATNAGFIGNSMPGIFESGGIGVVVHESGEITLLFRKKKISSSRLQHIMKTMEDVVYKMLPQQEDQLELFLQEVIV